MRGFNKVWKTDGRWRRKIVEGGRKLRGCRGERKLIFTGFGGDTCRKLSLSVGLRGGGLYGYLY